MIALGSEMSGGIKDVRAEDITAINTQSAVRIKTAVGRGAYVKDIFVKGMTLHTMNYVFWMTGSYGSHPDPGFDPKALPQITGINYRDVTADNVTYSARLDGIPNDPFTGICISNVTIEVSEEKKKHQWNCTDISGVTSNVTPEPCVVSCSQRRKRNLTVLFQMTNCPLKVFSLRLVPFKVSPFNSIDVLETWLYYSSKAIFIYAAVLRK